LNNISVIVQQNIQITAIGVLCFPFYFSYFYNYRAVQCVHAPKGSVVNFTAYQHFIELI
jgi:hypothetical protein